ncbi:MAG: LLM class flavin-dependent oxidoreductase [Acidimicrobiia bacterium]
MKIGIYFDLRNPPLWRQDWSRLYGFTLEMCEEAERLGADSVWLTEHHLFEDGYLTQPLTFAAAVAARTSRVRIGTAVLIAPYRKPVQIAEEATVVDLISAGRLDLGLGAGYRIPEFGLFGADFARRYRDTDATVAELRRFWDNGILTPPPVQERIPIYLGYQGPIGARRVGLMGERLLSIDRSLLGPYREGLIAGGRDPASAIMSGVVNSFVTDDPDGDWPVVSRHLAYQLDSYRRYMVEGTPHPPPPPVDPDRVIASRGKVLGSCIYGTPQQVAQEMLDITSGIPVDTVLFMASLAGMPEALVARTVRTICTGLAPLLRGQNTAGAT